MVNRNMQFEFGSCTVEVNKKRLDENENALALRLV